MYMYNNSSYNVNNPHPLIPREQNYYLDRKLVSIHSEDRDITKFPDPSRFDVILPQPIYNVQSMRLVQSTFPVDYYTFSDVYQNTRFHFTTFPLGNEEGIPFCAKIQEGTYNACQLAIELTNVMNLKTQDTTFSVFYDVVGSRFWFGNTGYKFTLDFEYKLDYPAYVNCVQPVVWYNYAKWGLPYYLGYDKIKYEASTEVQEINYIPPATGGLPIIWMVQPQQKVINIQGEKDIYMEVDKYNSYDELYPYTESNKSAFDNNAYTGKVNSAFAKLPIDTVNLQDSRNFLLINFVQYEPPIERINKLRFTFRFHDGRLVDFRGLEFNFTIEFNSLRNEILRAKNVRTASMLSL